MGSYSRSSTLVLVCGLALACTDDGSDAADADTETDTGDGDGDSGDGDGDPTCELTELLDQALWDEMFLHKDDPACSGSNYTLAGLLEAAADYPTFACEGDETTRRRELAAFLAQISHETTGGWPNAKTYHGRGAIQLSWNYNYGQAGDALGVDILSDPDLVKEDPKLAIQTALWFWMTEQLPKPSAHDVMVGAWAPSAADEAQGRLPGFGMTTNIINGGLECNMPGNAAVADRVGFFGRYVGLLATDPGDNVDCDMMSPY